tara:strand:- start:153 stop:467 length:315 start_codon:yes stop_codon:yes gene_type:complete
MKLFLKIVSFIFLVLIIENEIMSAEITEKEIVKISVNGLVCDFCGRSIEKLFSKKESVESIKVNLEKMLITIVLKKGKKLNNILIKQLIIDSGYDVMEIYRDQQ